MRGKILSIALVAVMISALLPALSYAQETAITVSIDPPLVTGYANGDTIDVNVYVSDPELPLYAWEVRVRYPPYMERIAVVDVLPGNFLEQAGTPFYVKAIDPFTGTARVGSSLTGHETAGAMGDGILCTVRFTVIEAAGAFEVLLTDPLFVMILDGMLIKVPSEFIGLVGGTFRGPTAYLDHIPGETRMGRNWASGNARRFKAIVMNDGYAPVWVRMKYTNVRGDGRITTLYNDQHLYTTQPRATEYYYVNEFTELRVGWTPTGTSPYLNAANDGSYVTGTVYCNTIRMFGFQDIVLNPGDIIYRVTLEGRTRAAHADIDYDVYDAAFNWYGSLWGTSAWTWRGVRWTTDTVDVVYPGIRTQAGFNGFQVLLHYYTPDGSGLGPADLDCLRLKVEFIGMDPLWVGGDYLKPDVQKTSQWAIWDLWPFDVGTYTTTATLEYRYGTPDPRFPQYWANGGSETWTWQVYP